MRPLVGTRERSNGLRFVFDAAYSAKDPIDSAKQACTGQRVLLAFTTDRYPWNSEPTGQEKFPLYGRIKRSKCKEGLYFSFHGVYNKITYMYSKPRNFFLLPLSLASGFLLLLSGKAQEPSNAWRFSFKKEGILIESQPTTNSSLLTFRATAQIPASIPRILSVFYDANHSIEWMQDTKEMRILEGSYREDNLCIYSRVKVSAGSDRDFIMRLTSSFYPETREMIVSFTSRPSEPCPLLPPVPGVIRMPRIEGAWTLRYKGDSLTEVEYKVYAEPGGLIQRLFGWIINSVSKNVPYNTLAALQKQVSRSDRGNWKLEQKIVESPEYRRFMTLPSTPK